jgi:hypothetical protein
MHTIHTMAAESINDQLELYCPLTIVCDLHPPQGSDPEVLRGAFQHAASTLVDAMLKSMPRGLVDHLLAELCERKASNLRNQYQYQ